MTTIDPRCGTTAGHSAHRRRKEPACKECRAAHTASVIAWRKANVDKVKAYKAKWLVENKEAIQQQRKEYCERTKDAKRQTTLKHYKNNKDLYLAAGRRRRARRRDNRIEIYSTQQVLDMYGTLCHICQEEIDLYASRRSGIGNWERGLHIDHVIPIAKGGSDTLDNVKPAHAQCNLSKSAKLMKE